MTDKNFINAMLSGKSWSLEKQPDLQNKGMNLDKTVPTYIDSNKALANYENKVLYEVEKQLLKWFEIKMADKNWRENKYVRRYTCSMLIKELFGREYDRDIDSKYTAYYARIFSHYCSRVSKTYWDKNTNTCKNKNCYHFSPARIKKEKPYSIRLRVEVYAKEGILPTYRNCKVYKTMTKGHARSNKVQKRMDERSKRAKESYAKRNNKSTNNR